MSDEHAPKKRSRFDQPAPEPRKQSRFDRRSRSPSNRHSEPRRSRSPIDSRSPASQEARKTPLDPAAAAGKVPYVLKLRPKLTYPAAAAAKINADLQARKGIQHVDVPPVQSVGIPPCSAAILLILVADHKSFASSCTSQRFIRPEHSQGRRRHLYRRRRLHQRHRDQ